MSLFDYFKELGLSHIKGIVRDIEDDVSEYVEVRVRRFERRMMNRLMSSFIFFLVVICFIVAVAFAFIEYLNLSVALSFLIVSVFLLLIGVIIKVRG